MSSSYDVIIAGIGSMGSAAAYHLAKRGKRVLGLNPHEIPHNLGSHHGRSRMIRQSYYEHPDYVPLLQRAYDLWSDLQEQSETPFFHLTGAVYFGAPDGAIVPGALEAAKEHKLPHDYIDDPNDIRTRFPAFRLPPNFAAFFEERGGYLVPEEAVRTHAKLAQNFGAQIHTGEPVTAWRPTLNGVEVTTPRDTYYADHFIITAGGWIADFLRDIAVEFKVTRQVLAWFVPKNDPQNYAQGSFPCWFIESETPYGYYGFPIAPGHNGLKLALHKPGREINPADLHHPQHLPTDEETDALRRFLHDFLPGSDGPLLESTVCLYTNTPDSHFILGPHPAHEETVTIACGFSGHGFKFASAIGEITADLATSGTTKLPIDFLSPKRFLS
ncbi:MAG: N-methyl-L-tryptophan oxidase [Verrucomicrobiota bacterium]